MKRWPVLFAAATPLGDTGSSFTYQNLVKMVTELVKIGLQVAELLAVIMIAWFGLRMVLSRGDAAQFTTARKNLMLALVGAIVIFGVYTIIATVQGAVQSVGN